MRKLKLIEHISLDGFIQTTDEDGFPYGDWSAPYRSPEGLAVVLEIYGEKFDLLLGRKTYDIFSNFWPKAPKSPMSDRLNAATKFVITHNPQSVEWGPVKALNSNLVEDVRALKESSGRDLIMAGSSTLASILLENGLADEVILLVNPVLIGKGKRFFTEGTEPRALSLESSKAMPSGILVNKYKYDGKLKNLK